MNKIKFRKILIISLWLVMPDFYSHLAYAQDDAKAVLQKLSEEKLEYEAGVAKVISDLTKTAERKLEQAESRGQQKTVEVLISELKGLGSYGDLPPWSAVGHRNKLNSLVKKMDSRYSEARVELVKLQLSEVASQIDREQEEFRFLASMRATRTTLLGTWNLKMPNYSSNFTFFPDGTMYHSTQNFKAVWNVDLPSKQIVIGLEKAGRRRDRIYLPLNARGTKGKSSSGGEFTLTKKR